MWALILIILSIALLCEYLRRCLTYWQREGVPEEPFKFPFSVMNPIMTQKRCAGLVMCDLYNKHNTKMVGFYGLHKPQLLIRDPELIANILTSSFANFHDRGFPVDEQDELGSQLIIMKGAAWRNMRNKLKPTFSSGKIKGMFATIDEVGHKMVQHLNLVLENDAASEIDLKEKLTTYAVDIVGSVMFGLDIDSFTQPNNEFRTFIDGTFKHQPLLTKIHHFVMILCPFLIRYLNLVGLNNRFLYPLRDIVKRTVEYRERNNVVRKDLLQLLIRLRNTGKIGDDNDQVWNMETELAESKSMSIEKITAQCFLFYLAGAESTSSASSLTLYELAMYPQLLKEAQDEVVAVLQKHNIKPNGVFAYEAVQDMKFLEQCVMETIRKYPILPFLNRICSVDYSVPGENYTIKKDMPIVISLLGMHRDSAYFSNPNGYEPHRFDADAPNYDPAAYMPFGAGPRHCIAQRLGTINTKVAVAKVLANFNIAQAPRKEIDFKFDFGPFLIPDSQIKLRLSKRVQGVFCN